MTLDEFKSSLADADPNPQLPSLLQAMWWDGKGDWEQAHNIAQEVASRDGSWVHAYLHRKEGDLGNAGYWYRRANRPVFSGSLEEEWEHIVAELIES